MVGHEITWFLSSYTESRQHMYTYGREFGFVSTCMSASKGLRFMPNLIRLVLQDFKDSIAKVHIRSVCSTVTEVVL